MGPKKKLKIILCQGYFDGGSISSKIISVFDVLLGTKSCFMLMMMCFCMFRYTFSTLTTNTISYPGQ
jgi:hypothetical protein